MAGPSIGINVKRLLEWIAAAIGAFNCAMVPLQFAPRQQPLFLLPGLYFIEIALVGLVVLVATAVRPSRWGPYIPWVAASIMLTFVILAGFSIGPFLIPSLIAFIVTGLLADWQTGGSIGKHVGVFIIAAVVQADIMLLFILFTRGVA